MKCLGGVEKEKMREGHLEEVIRKDTWEKTAPGRSKHKCKGPGGRKSLKHSRN